MLSDRFLKNIQVAINNGDYHLGIKELTEMRTSLLSSGKQTKDSQKLSEIIEQIKRVDQLIERLKSLSQHNNLTEKINEQVSIDKNEFSAPSIKVSERRIRLEQNYNKIKNALIDLLFGTKENQQDTHNVLLVFGHEKAGKSIFFNEITASLDINAIIVDFRELIANQSTYQETIINLKGQIKSSSSRTLILIDHLDDDHESNLMSKLQPKRIIEDLMGLTKDKRLIPVVILASNARQIWTQFFNVTEIDQLIEFTLPNEEERREFFVSNLNEEETENLVNLTKYLRPYQIVDLKSYFNEASGALDSQKIKELEVSKNSLSSFAEQLKEYELLKGAANSKESHLFDLIHDIHFAQEKMNDDSVVNTHQEWNNDGFNKNKEESPQESFIDHEKNIDLIQGILKEYGVNFDEISYVEGLAYTRYKIRLSSGERIQKVTKSSNEIKMRLQSKNVRIVAPIDKEDAIGIELPNEHRKSLSFREISVPKPILEIPVGMDINNNIVSIDFSKDPHFLVGGSTGSGKSVNLNVFIAYILTHRHPDEVQLLLIDPKRVEFSIYYDLPHSITSKPVNEIDDIQMALGFLINTMDERYKTFEQQSLRNIQEFNSKSVRKLPYIFAVVDEFATLSENDEIMDQIQRLSQLARAAGIHILLATQRPSTDIVKGTIKNNFTGRIAFKVSNNHDSKTTIYDSGAEDLIGKGDMLIANSGESVNRAQGAFISIDEIKSIIRTAQDKYGTLPEIKHSFKE